MGAAYFKEINNEKSKPATMKWQDVFYFAKGERQALGLLLGLIALTWAAVIYTDGRREPDAPVAVATRDTIVGPARDTTRTTPRRDTTPPPTPLPRARAEAKKADSPRRSATYDKKRASRPRYPRVEKYPAGTVVELNSADTTILKRVPGIGSAFARRIVNFRAALGGFHSVEQLSEVYGIDAERYRALRPWFAVDTAAIRPLAVNRLTARQLARHPYVSYPQARVIERLARRRGGLRGWEELSLLEEFTPADRRRLRPYLSFEGD